MNLRQIPSGSLRGKRILMRVDWNIPLHGKIAAEDLLKIERSALTLRALTKRGAIVIAMTHLGRPEGPDPKFSTKKLTEIARRRFKITVTFLLGRVDLEEDRERIRRTIGNAQPGAVFLLENVRFLKEEESNGRMLSKAYASLADFFVNDAFASCHRKHVSVVGVTRYLPSYAGPTLIEEVKAMDRLIEHPKHPVVAIIGGAKLSTKIGVISSLLRVADAVCIGGAMAHPFLVARGFSVGRSLLEEEGIIIAKKMMNNKKIHLPVDVNIGTRVVSVASVGKEDVIGDIGSATLRAWSLLLAKARTIVWNGPVGITEQKRFASGSLALARDIASRSRSSACYGVVGGGDTLPIALASKHARDIDHLSTGGGAMLEYIARNGKLPGIVPLILL